MFGKAVKWGWISTNPFGDVERAELIVRDWHYLKPDEYKRLLDAAPSLRWQACYALAYTAGLRFSELFNLAWSDIDFEVGEVRIRVKAGTAKMPPFKPKTRQSIRSIPVIKHTLAILAGLYNEVPEQVPYVLLSKRQYRTAIEKWNKYREEKRVWDPQDIVNNVPRELNRHLEKAGLRPDEGKTLTLHTLRKCAGKNWADHIPNPKVTQMLMGHASLATTMKYYNRVSKADRKVAADVVEALFAKSDAQLTPATNLKPNRQKERI